MNAFQEIQRRRTFAIISHPDAGKTTLTEKLLLYGGALHLAGSVTARKHQRETSSDWMELEKKRGISISSTVLQFDYGGYRINLLDTPGHKDFSEDTYRVLMAVDAAVMVIDAGKGIEAQTRKLFEVCRRRGVPIFTFMNKLDRPSLEPLALIDELESVLNIHAYPMNWPLGNGSDFKGVFDRRAREVHLFERTVGGAYRAPVSIHGLSDDFVRETLDSQVYGKVCEEIEILDHAQAGFDEASVLAGETTPVFFGSASNNFGVQLMLDGFTRYSAPPAPRLSGETLIPVDKPEFSGFIFKIQANMDPKHRDRIAFLRVCSGKFSRDMMVSHSGSDKKVRLAYSHKLFGQTREIIEEAYPGDIVGLVGNDSFRIGDTLTEDPAVSYHEIPRFPPECFSFIRNPKPDKHKAYQKGLDQLLNEGIVQSFRIKDGRGPVLAAVGPLQFEVVQYRILSEYGADTVLDPAPWKVMKWLDEEADTDAVRAQLPFGADLGEDSQQRPVVFFPNPWSVEFFQEKNPSVRLHDLAPGSKVL
ncbi:MAG: peptide chain release factor 3 [Candidatus Omnitrophica bacterium]|nr:peptide chain release factor 3 [Candidatus Omnitrophota bacterium]